MEEEARSNAFEGGCFSRLRRKVILENKDEQVVSGSYFISLTSRCEMVDASSGCKRSASTRKVSSEVIAKEGKSEARELKKQKLFSLPPSVRKLRFLVNHRIEITFYIYSFPSNEKSKGEQKKHRSETVVDARWLETASKVAPSAGSSLLSFNFRIPPVQIPTATTLPQDFPSSFPSPLPSPPTPLPPKKTCPLPSSS